MERTNPLLSVGSSGRKMAALHKALAVHGYPIARTERRGETFGESTLAAICQLQKHHGLPVTGVVDAATVAALNRADEAGAAAPTPARRWPWSARSRAGADPRATGSPAPITASALPVSTTPPPETTKPPINVAAAPTGPPAHPAAPPVDHTTPPDGGRSGGEVNGHVYHVQGSPVPGLRLRLYHVGFGATSTFLADATTAADGGYRMGYPRRGTVNLQVRALDPAGEELALLETIVGAAPVETVNLVAPDNVAPLADEYRRLLADLASHLGHGRLADAQEGAGRRDITMLARATGWDARLVALAVNADRLAAQIGTQPAPIYALLRIGLPADAARLAALPMATVDAAFARAAAGIVQLTQAEADSAKTALRSFARTHRRNNPASPGSLSTMGQMLTVSGLSPAEQDIFDEIVATHSGSSEQLWGKVQAAGLAEPKIAALQLQGKLGVLTRDNARLTVALQQEIGSVAQLPATLLSHDFHEAEPWQAYLRKVAGGNDTTLAELVPPAYVGDTTAARVAAYAEDMARRVRVAWPTEVITRRLQTGDLRVAQVSGAASTALTANVVTVLQRATGLGFELGTTPARPFLRDNHEVLFAGMPGPDVDASRQAVLTIQRLYQITPGDQAMQVLLDAGLRSAYEVSGYDIDAFIAQYGTALGGDEVARSVYSKAKQVNAVAYGVYGAAAMVHSSVPMFGVRR